MNNLVIRLYFQRYFVCRVFIGQMADRLRVNVWIMIIRDIETSNGLDLKSNTNGEKI